MELSLIYPTSISIFSYMSTNQNNKKHGQLFDKTCFFEQQIFLFVWQKNVKMSLIIDALHFDNPTITVLMEVTSKSKPKPKSQTKAIDDKQQSQWDQLVMALIRPPRHQYNPNQLSSRIQCGRYSTIYQREDFQIPHESQSISLTIYKPPKYLGVLILYLHGNSSSKLQAMGLLQFVPQGFALASFDFLGCGISDDQYISLGVRESEQIQSVVDYLREKQHNVILWGRSMGAVSALRNGSANIIVADSPFVSLERVCKQTAHGRKPKYLPGCMVTCCFPFVFTKLRSDVKKKADFDLKDLNTKKSVEKMDSAKCLVFLSGSKDTLIHHRHAQELYKTFKGENKKLFLFEGTHNTKRPPQVLVQVMDYVKVMAEQYFGKQKDDQYQTAVETEEVQINI